MAIPEFDITSGKRVAVIGPSGTGKTTLLNLIAGISVPDSGSVVVHGEEISSLGDSARRSFRARNIGFVFQNFALMDYLSAAENVRYPYRVAPQLRIEADTRDRVAALADACGIGGKLDRYPSQLSQGEQQRVAICRALIARPKLILADEATGNLDPATKTSILDLLFERAMETGATVLAVTHDHELVPRFDEVFDFATFRATEPA